MRNYAIITACLLLSGCTSQQLTAASQTAPVAVQVAAGASPTIAKDVAQACAAALPVASTAASVVKGGAAATANQINNLVTASCSTPAAQEQLTANDANPVQPDGGSAKWLAALTTAARVIQAVAPVAEIAAAAL